MEAVLQGAAIPIITVHLHRVADAPQLGVEPLNWSLQVGAGGPGIREMVEMPVEPQVRVDRALLELLDPSREGD